MADQVAALLKALEETISRAHDQLRGLRALLDGSDTDEGWTAFWAVYPRKTAKPLALKAWRKLNPDQEMTAAILAAVTEQKTWPQWTKDAGTFVPHPATWLNQRRWEDEGITRHLPLMTPTICPHRPPCTRSTECVKRVLNASRAERGQPLL